MPSRRDASQRPYLAIEHLHDRSSIRSSSRLPAVVHPSDCEAIGTESMKSLALAFCLHKVLRVWKTFATRLASDPDSGRASPASRTPPSASVHQSDSASVWKPRLASTATTRGSDDCPDENGRVPLWSAELLLQDFSKLAVQDLHLVPPSYLLLDRTLPPGTRLKSTPSTIPRSTPDAAVRGVPTPSDQVLSPASIRRVAKDVRTGTTSLTDRTRSTADPAPLPSP